MHFRGKRFFMILLMLLSSAFIANCSGSKDATKADTDEAKKEQQAPKEQKKLTEAELSERAKRMLRLDDYKAFEQGEVDFYALGAKNSDDPILKGWLVQLYIAWLEQLRSLNNLLRLKVTASELANNETDKANFYALIDFNDSQLEHVTERAVTMGNDLIAKNPDSYIGHRAMADYYRIMGDKDMMEMEVAEVKRLNPNSNGLLFVQGASKAQFEGDYETAIEFYDKAIANDPMFVKAIYFKGLAQQQLGQMDAAKETMKLVLEKSPNHPGAKAFFSTEEYIAKLSKLAKKELKEMAKGLQLDIKPKFVTWSAYVSAGKPMIKYRIAGSTKPIELKAKASIVNKQGEVITSGEKEFTLEANGSFAATEIFQPLGLEETEEANMLIQLFAKKDGEEDFTLTIDMHQEAFDGLDISEEELQKPEKTEEKAE